MLHHHTDLYFGGTARFDSWGPSGGTGESGKQREAAFGEREPEGDLVGLGPLRECGPDAAEDVERVQGLLGCRLRLRR